MGRQDLFVEISVFICQFEMTPFIVMIKIVLSPNRKTILILKKEILGIIEKYNIL